MERIEDNPIRGRAYMANYLRKLSEEIEAIRRLYPEGISQQTLSPVIHQDLKSALDNLAVRTQETLTSLTGEPSIKLFLRKP